ncbi:hypothetical protein [Streptomyces griseus]|uniref:hypothetical protein n=1 Tax=Streptomyces griseus TaxID=1911 RepID=UPI000564A450|nr:hypothetical protein [Streptomyces griseus]
MRTRPALAAVFCAAALSASVFPAAAHAAGGAAASDTTFKVSVDGGKDIVLGLNTKKTVTITWTAKDPDGVVRSWAYLWHGPNVDDMDGHLPAYPPAGTCAVSPTDPTTSTCETTFTVDAERDVRENALAGTWNVLAEAQDTHDDWTAIDVAGTARIKRNAVVTVNASPEPVRTGRTVTVAGKLTRADWASRTYTGYRGQSVQLQFRMKGSNTYTTLKTITSGAGGALKTTTRARTDGYFRFVFAGTGTTGPSTAAGDFVDVR